MGYRRQAGQGSDSPCPLLVSLVPQEHPPAMNHLDSSSNPSSTTSSTPSSPAPFPTSSNPSSATTPPNPSPGQRDSRFNFPGNHTLGLLCAFRVGSDAPSQHAPAGSRSNTATTKKEHLLGAKHCAKFKYITIFTPDESSEVDAVITPILQMGILRFQRKWLTLSCITRKGQSHHQGQICLA